MMGRTPYDHYYYHGSFYNVYADCVDSAYVRAQWQVAIQIHGLESTPIGILIFKKTPSSVKLKSAIKKYVRNWLKNWDNDVNRNFYIKGEVKYDRG